MKRIFTHLFVTVLLLLSSTAWAQSGVQTITVSPTGGTFASRTDGVTSVWRSGWTSNASPVVTISVLNGVNNLDASTTSAFKMARGSAADSTWELAVEGYNIASYSFKFKSFYNNQDVTIKSGSKTMTSSYSTEQTWEVTDVNAEKASFVLSGNNYSILVTELTFEVYDPTVLSTLVVGKVYNFKNVEYGKSMASVGTEKTAIADTDLTDYTQLWYVGEGSVTGTYTLRNLGNGLYLQGGGQGSKWPFVDEPSNLYYQTAGTGFSMTANSECNAASGYWMHYGSGNGCVVGWNANAGASQWVATEVEISANELQANWEEVALLNGASGKVAEYQGYLNNLFTDKSCTTPKKTLTSASAIEADADYQKLPTGLQAMVKKVYLGDWGESNIVSTKAAWSSKHAKRFRVQQYEPYSYAERTNSMLGIYAHSNMNNPTGLVANQRNLLYIMVEGEIKEGAKLYIQSLVGEDRLGNIGGVELTEGLNIVPYWSDGNQLFIQYVVNTYENGAKTGYKLSQYSPLKIHIEGGCINGCFDTVGDAINPADTDADWDAYEDRAHQYNFTVLGKYMMWHMPLVIDDSNTDYLDLSGCLGTNATSVKTAMDAWETIESAQRLMEGLLSEQEINTIPNASRVFEYTGNDPDEQYPSDYSEEYNNRSMAYSTKDGYFMFAADWSSHYASNTLDDVIRDIATGGDPWGPAHEIGHTYQGPINLPSTSETSNNAIANVSNWFMGRTSSRLGSTQSLLDQYNNNTSFLGTDANSGNVWEKLMMYTKLWFYYHVTGHNKKFYPRLFEMLRRDPIVRQQGVALSGTETMLKFYKFACMAAEEDLTDFFEVFGFFVPVDGTLSDDYGDFKTVMTQAEIDAAKAEVAAMAAEKGWKKNSAIIFIDDRIGTVYSHDGVTPLGARGDGGKEQGVLGSINDFDSNPDNDVAPLTGEYTYTVLNNTISMQGGTGGVGFLIYDADGNLVGFSNKYTFPLGEKAQAALASGTARVVVITDDIDAEPVEISDANSTQTQTELLAGLLPVVAELLDYEDATGTKVGWYKSSAFTALKAAYNKALEIYNNKEYASYGGAYAVLYEEYNAVATSLTAKVEFVDGRTYYLKNVGSGKYMSVDGSGNVIANSTVPTATTTASLWQINAGFYDTFYSLKNQSTGTYVRKPQKEGDKYNNGQQFVMTSDPHTFIFEEVSTGKFAIKDRDSKKYLNFQSDKVATWGGNDTGSQWEIVYLPTDGTMAQRAELEDLMLLTQVLIDEVGYAAYTQLKLQKDPSKANYLYCNAPHGTDDGDGKDGEYVANLTDGKTSSYLHTVWSGNSTDGENHYLRVDLGDGNELDLIKFVYATRSSSNLDMPSRMQVQGSNSETTGYVTLAELTKDDATNPLPTASGTISWYKSSAITSATPYRYYRFMVTETKRGTKDGSGHYYFTMSEFQLYKRNIWLNSEYNTQVNLKLLDAALEKMVKAQEAVANSAATEAELKEAYNTLNEAYEQLLTAKTTVDNSALDAEKERLSTLITSARNLVDSCKEGEFVSHGATETVVNLQATDANAENYLYCNALYNKSAGNNNGDNSMNTYKLLDNNTETYIHTIYNEQKAEDNLDHYLRIYFGENAQNGFFRFAYHTRKVSDNSVHPEVIKIEGSNNLAEGFEEIITISSGLPNKVDADYLSAVMGNGKNYRYIRLMVTDTYADAIHSTNADDGEHKSFCLAEFDFWTVTKEYLEVTLSANCGNATETMVLDAYRAVQAAQEALAMATTAQQLQTAYSVLEAAYTVLNEAKNAVNKAALETAVQNAGTMLGSVTTDGVVNDRYSDAEAVVSAIEALNNAVDAAQTVLDAVQTTQDAIDTARGNVETAMATLQIELDKDVPTENRTTLNSLLTQTTGLVNEIATVSTEETVIPLQCDNSDNDYYIWTNAQQPGDDNHIRNLLDTDAGTMFHSSWGNGATNVNEKHYLAIDLGKSSIKEFVFNYTTYAAWYSYCPTDITIQGSNDFVEFTDIRNLTDGDSEKPLLSTDASSDYTSMILNADGKYYRYLRFVVNENRHSGKFNEQYYFQLATFGVTSKGTTIAINGNYALSNVTADMVSAAYSEAAAVAEIAGKYMTQKQYDDACTSLQAVYTALENAKNINKATLEQALAAAIAQRETLTNTEGNLDEYWTTSTAMVLAFEELNSKTEAAQRVFNSKTATQQEINDAATALNGATTALREIINLDYADNETVSRDDLRDLIAASTSLLEQVTTGEAAQFVPQELVTALEAKKDEAANVVERYMTESDYNTMLQALRQEYDALNDALSIANSKVELKRLVDETTLLKNSLYEIAVASYKATEVDLQCDTEGAAGYLYCNAPGEKNYWGDGLGVKALLDKTDGTDNTETYMHTPYDTNLDDNKDGLDHYLRVDLGTEGAVAYLEFGYVCRDGYTSLTPSTVVVEATNDLTAKWTTIKTLTLARPSTTAETKTGALGIGNGVAYRYWRFMVTATHDGRECNGHPYFALSDFNVYKCTDVVLDSQLKSEYTPNIHMYTTAELVAEVEDAINDANTVCNDANTTIDDCNSEKEALQAEYDKLAEAIELYWTPVKLTTDETAPVLYTINAPGRSDANNSKAWQYNAQNNNITIVNKGDTNLYHLWYFIEGGEEHTVKIVPVMTPEYTLGATDFNHGENKVSAVAESDVDWSFDYVGNYYNFKAHGKNVYISNYGGGSKALGFYGVDNGSYVSFSEVEVENYALARLAKLADSHSTVVAGDEFGCFTVQSANPYNEAVDAATALVETNSTDNAACVSAFTALYESNKNLELLLPEDETVLCTITNVARTGGKMFANGETEPVLRWDNNDVTAKYIFTFEPTGEKGKYYMKSLERGTYISTAFGHGGGVENIAAARDTAKVVTIANMSPTSRAVSITPVGGAMLHADASGNANKVVAWDNAAAGGASAWLLDEVTDLSQVTHTAALGANESGADKNAYSTLYLAYNAVIPDGITASIVTAVEDDDQLAMTPVTGGILPANTAVVLSGNTAGDVEFGYTDEEADFNTEGNLLRGTSYNKLVECGDEYNVYMLGKKNGRVAFYWTYENRDASGNKVTVDGLGTNHNQGGYVLCNANKAYLQESESRGQAAATMYSLPIGGNTTGAEGVKIENGEVKAIYDLQGRKLVKITSPGIYMVDGKKVYVTEVED